MPTAGAEGVEYVPELKKFYTSNAGDNTIGVVDLKQMKVINKLKTEAKPDGSTYAAAFHKLYVSDERGKAEAVVDGGHPVQPEVRHGSPLRVGDRYQGLLRMHREERSQLRQVEAPMKGGHKRSPQPVHGQPG